MGSVHKCVLDTVGGPVSGGPLLRLRGVEANDAVAGTRHLAEHSKLCLDLPLPVFVFMYSCAVRIPRS
jgi:hypothetical protein